MWTELLFMPGKRPMTAVDGQAPAVRREVHSRRDKGCRSADFGDAEQGKRRADAYTVAAALVIGNFGAS